MPLELAGVSFEPTTSGLRYTVSGAARCERKSWIVYLRPPGSTGWAE